MLMIHSFLKNTFLLEKYSNDGQIFDVEGSLYVKKNTFFSKIQRSSYGMTLEYLKEIYEGRTFLFLRGGVKLNINH